MCITKTQCDAQANFGPLQQTLRGALIGNCSSCADGSYWNMGTLPAPPTQSACQACTTLCADCSWNFEIGV